jgi:hypothetical protein
MKEGGKTGELGLEGGAREKGCYDIMPHLLFSVERFCRREKDW